MGVTFLKFDGKWLPTSVEEIEILGLIVARVPMVFLAVLAGLHYKNIRVVVGGLGTTSSKS
jgi:hypothetical protein